MRPDIHLMLLFLPLVWRGTPLSQDTRRDTDFLPLISAQLAAMARLDLSKESVNQKLVAHPSVLTALSLRGGPHVPPFNLRRDLARGALRTVQVALLYVFMLAVMYVSRSCLS